MNIIYYLVRKNPNTLALKFDYFSIFLYGAIFFSRRLILFKNNHDHPAVLSVYNKKQLIKYVDTYNTFAVNT